MNWRRGLLLAGIHLVVAVGLIRFMEARDAQSMKGWGESSAEISKAPAPPKPPPDNPAPAQDDSAQEGETVTFSPCGMWVHYTPQETVVQFAEFPAYVLTDWREACPPNWTLSGMIRDWSLPTTSRIAVQHHVDEGLCALIIIQWFLVGSFPLIHPRRPWGEPGAFITVCAVLALMLAMIPVVDGAARLPALIAWCGWLWWFGLLVWKALRSGWRLAQRTAASR
jgi:hypothetical protein